MADNYLSADSILSVNDIKMESIDVPEWGGRVCVRSLSGIDRDTWEVYAQAEFQKVNKPVNMRAKLASLCLCDSEGNRIFTDAQVNKLAEKSAKALDRVYEAAISVNALSGEEIDAIEKN